MWHGVGLHRGISQHQQVVIEARYRGQSAFDGARRECRSFLTLLAGRHVPLLLDESKDIPRCHRSQGPIHNVGEDLEIVSVVDPGVRSTAVFEEVQVSVDLRNAEREAYQLPISDFLMNPIPHSVYSLLYFD